jgi:hypothetical protein
MGKIMMTSPPTIPDGSEPATVSRTPTNGSSTLINEMTEIHDPREDGSNNVDINNNEIDNTSVNDSNDGQVKYSRSTSSGGWHSEGGDDSSTSSRREELASKETRAVTKLKLLVFGSLFVSMMAVALAAYYLTSQAEQAGFELHFYDDANKLLGNIGQNVERTMEASDAFITSVTSYAAHTNQTWPFVVIPDFAVRAEKLRSLCGAIYVTTYHFVEHDQRVEWENFTASVGREMADEAIAALSDYKLMDWPITTNYTEWNVIYDYGEYDKENPVSTLKSAIDVKCMPIQRLIRFVHRFGRVKKE